MSTKNIIIQIPGKTFLIGEYVATVNGPSLIFTSKPKFRFSGIATNNKQTCPFHADSPAGKFYQLYKNQLQNHHFKFSNPYNQGGLGASTAEFLGLYLYTKKLFNLNQLENRELVSLYQSLSISKGTLPSGADLIAQYHQGISFYHPAENIQQSHSWPFKELSLLLFHTNKKLATHEHLQNLKTNLNFNVLKEISHSSYQAFSNANQINFIDSIKSYNLELEKLNLVAKHTQLILKEISNNQPEVLAAKGCGALGADVFMLLCHMKNKDKLINIFSKQNYHLMATEKQLANYSKMN